MQPARLPSTRWSRRRVLGFGALLAAELAPRWARAADATTALELSAQRALAALASWSDAQHATLGAHVADALSGRTLAAIAAHRPLNPASNQKILTMAAALEALGPAHRFTTSLHGTVAEGGALRELVLRGDGDPSLKSADLQQLVRGLKERGVSAIAGDLLVDQSAFDERWEPPAYAQRPNDWASYRAPVSAVAIEGNAVVLHIAPTQAGKTARAWLSPAGVMELRGAVETRARGKASVRFDLIANGTELSARIAGFVPANGRELAFPRRLADPSLAAGRVLSRLLSENGVALRGQLRRGGAGIAAELARVSSRPLSELLLRVGKHSDNFAAEMLLKALGARVSGAPGSSAAGAAAIVNYLSRNGALEPGTSIVNGSGLYDANRVSASTLTRVLSVVGADRRIGNELIASLPIGGVDGTLRERFRALSETQCLRAKTGTLADVVTLSGYILRPPPRTPLVFSLLLNGVSGKTVEARGRLDRAIETIAQSA